MARRTHRLMGLAWFALVMLALAGCARQWNSLPVAAGIAGMRF